MKQLVRAKTGTSKDQQKLKLPAYKRNSTVENRMMSWDLYDYTYYLNVHIWRFGFAITIVLYLEISKKKTVGSIGTEKAVLFF